jgi:hypothetical protein
MVLIEQREEPLHTNATTPPVQLCRGTFFPEWISKDPLTSERGLSHVYTHLLTSTHPLHICSRGLHPSTHLRRSCSPACAVDGIVFAMTQPSRACHIIAPRITSHRCSVRLLTLTSLVERTCLAPSAAATPLTPHPANSVDER